MDVVPLPRPLGCLWIGLQIMTLGIITLPLRAAERHFARRLDEEGAETRGGKRIRWAEVTSARPIRHVLAGNVLADEIIFTSPRGRFSLHSRRMANYRDLADYALRRVPPAVVRTGD